MHSEHRVVMFALAAGLLFGGCASTAPPQPPCGNPDAEVLALRNAWQARTCGAPCESRGASPFGQATPPSKELIRREGENLAYRHPDHVATLLFAALTAYEAHDTNRAVQHLDDLLRLDPANADAAVLRARIAMEQGNVPYARRLLETEVALHPDHAALHETLASALFLSGDSDGALRTLDVAERLGASPWRVAYNRGLVEEARGNLAQARTHYHEALAAWPNYAPATERLRGLEKGEKNSIAGLVPPIAKR